MGPDIALAASTREWPDRLHRFLLDHGGGRIVDRVMGPDQAASVQFDVLLIDDVCSFLTPRLVTLLKQAGAEVIGVYMPEDGPDAKRRLLECGISDVIETEATPEEFLAKIGTTLSYRTNQRPPEGSRTSAGFRIAVTGPCEGVGVTEISIALARSVASDLVTVLIDLDPRWPSVAQRLDLPLHPNIRTALDYALHRTDRLEEAMHRLGELRLIGGRADGGHGPELNRADSLMLLDALETTARVVVADLGPITESTSALLREFDTVIVVGVGTPVGVARLIKTANGLSSSLPGGSVLTVVNKIQRGGYRRSEIVTEIGRSLPGLPVVTLPYEIAVERAAWDGTIPAGGRYGKAVEAMSAVVVRTLT